MVRSTKRFIVPTLVIAFMQVLSFLYAGYDRQENQSELRIKLRPINLVVGNQIKLGEICEINIKDTEIQKRFSNINVGLAPPPGESIEITLISIKKKITQAGFSEYLEFVTGPKTIRVETAHREIDKAFLQEEFAHLQNDNSNNDKKV